MNDRSGQITGILKRFGLLSLSAYLRLNHFSVRFIKKIEECDLNKKTYRVPFPFLGDLPPAQYPALG